MNEVDVAVALESAGIRADAALRLADYCAGLLEANAAVNLSAARTPAAVLDHLVDSLTLAAYVRGPIADIGSGGGFPAIPLAIVTGEPVLLVEAVGKKAAYLQAQCARLSVDATVVTGRAESIAHDERYRGRFLTATARAVGSATEVLELTLPFLAVGGVALLQRGREVSGERNAIADAALVLGGEALPEIMLDGERRIIRVAKTALTGPRFPRRVGVPARRPLCVAAEPAGAKADRSSTELVRPGH